MSRHYAQTNLRWQLAIAALGAAALLAGCSSGPTFRAASPSKSFPAAPTASPSVSCVQITALGRALANVSHITVNAKTGSQVSADLTTIETALTALKGDAQSLYTAEAGHIVDTLTVIDEQAQLLSLRPTARNLKVTKIAVNELKKSVSSVTTQLRTACPPS